MTKATYRRTCLLGLYGAHSLRGLEFMTVMAGSIAEGRRGYGTGAMAENAHLEKTATEDWVSFARNLLH